MEEQEKRTPKDALKVKQEDSSTEDYTLVKGILVLGVLYLAWDVIDQRTGFASAPLLFGFTPDQILTFAFIAFWAAAGIACLVLKLKER